jgi:hypothetical protein
MLSVRFLFVGEGSFDLALCSPLEDLCIWCGADEVVGIAPDLRQTNVDSHQLTDKIRGCLELEPGVNLIFVHRDADAQDASPRHAEIEEALNAVDLDQPGVPVVPVQMTEAWALLCESAIRRAAENPNGSVELDIPSPVEVESISDPKAKLEALLVRASELSGRQLDRFKRDLQKRKRRIVRQLDVSGPISEVPAWNHLREQLRSTLQDIRYGRV